MGNSPSNLGSKATSKRARLIALVRPKKKSQKKGKLGPEPPLAGLEKKSPAPVTQPAPEPDDPIVTKIPLEVLELILTYAWHGADAASLPGQGTFSPSYRGALHPAPQPDAVVHFPPPLGQPPQPQPITGMIGASVASTPDEVGEFPPRDAAFRSVAGVCTRWRGVARRIAFGYVSLVGVEAFEAYGRAIGVDEEGEGERWATRRARCRTLHVHMPAGSLSYVPGWEAVPPILHALPLLVHVILTVADPHPALGYLLSVHLPPSVRALDIHISSEYEWKTTSPLEIRNRDGVRRIERLGLGARDPKLLGRLLEGFSETVPAADVTRSNTTRTSNGADATEPTVALRKLTLFGPHVLTGEWFMQTVGPSTGITTLELYDSRRDIDVDAEVDADEWDLVATLENPAVLPKLDTLHLFTHQEAVPGLAAACTTRGVRLVTSPHT